MVLFFPLIPIHCCSPFCLLAIGLPSVKTMFSLVSNGKRFQHLSQQISQGHPQGREMAATRGQRG